MKDYKTERFNHSNDFKSLKLYFDGCCEPKNPNGNLGYGWMLESEDIIAEGWGHELYDGSRTTSNNMAEWLAVLGGLNFLIENKITFEKLTVFGDSKMVINQCIGHWKINEGKGYSEYGFEFLKTVKPNIKKPYYQWIPREQNEYCDILSKRFIELTGTKLHSSDFGRKTKPKKKWKTVRRHYA